MAFFEILKTKNNRYRLLVKTHDRIEFMTDEYESRTRAIVAINKIRRNAQRHDSYKFVELECGSWLYQLYDMSRNMLLGYSQSHISKEEIGRKVEEMRVLVPFAKFHSVTHTMHLIQ